MPEMSVAKTKTARLLMLITILTLVFSLVLPQSVATATPAGSADESASYDYSLIERDYKSLQKMYSRYKADVKPLAKGLDTLLQNYRILQDRGNKKWIDMRILYYDYNSYYQASISHQAEVELLFQNHYGFNNKGKITNEPMAKYTVGKLRGAVVQMINNIAKAKSTLQAGKKMMKTNSVIDKSKNKKESWE
jgi:hypothetical protein